VATRGAYGFADGIWAGMPVRSTATGYEAITTVAMDDFAKSRIGITNEELVGERETVKEMLGA
jgi:malate dehydrogenase